MDDLAGKHAVVTGAASGIGLAFTRRLLRDGARVVMADVEAGALERAARELDAASVLAVTTDVTDPAAVDALAARAQAQFGAVDLVFANAGVTTTGAAWESTLDDWRWMWSVNVMGAVHCVRAFVPTMIASGRPGHVCFTGSLAGYMNQPGFAAYNATKHAISAIAETLAADLRLAGHPIGVTVVAPWFVTTHLDTSARNRPAELADAAPMSDYMRQLWAALGTTRNLSQTADEVADQTIDAMRAGRFSVFPFPPSLAAVRARFETVLAGDVLGLYTP